MSWIDTLFARLGQAVTPPELTSDVAAPAPEAAPSPTVPADADASGVDRRQGMLASLRGGGADRFFSPEVPQDEGMQSLPIWQGRSFDINGVPYIAVSDMPDAPGGRWIGHPEVFQALRDARIPAPGMPGRWLIPQELAPLLQYVQYMSPDNVFGDYFLPIVTLMVGGAGMLSGAAGGAASGAASTAVPTAVGGTAAAGGTISTTLSPLAQGAVQGAVNGAMSALASGGNPFDAALQGAALGSVSGGVGGAAGLGASELGANSAVIQAMTENATRAATIAVATGQDVAEAAARGAVAALSAETGPAEKAPAQTLAPLAAPESVQGVLADIPEAVPGMTLPVEGNPALDITRIDPAMLNAILSNQGMLQPQAPVGGSSMAGVETQEPTAAVQEAPTDTVTRYARYAKKVYDAYTALAGASQDAPAFEMPERDESQSEEEYLEEVGNYAVEYLSLDPDAMREAGLTPGTQEYLDYILEQADAIIAAVFGENPEAVLDGATVEDLQAAVRDLAAEESQQLLRALNVRGALGQMTASDTVTDPFTGIGEETGALPGEEVSGAIAGQQRGYARSLKNLLGMPSGEAAEALRGMLGRDIDLFGLQGSADARALAAQLAETDESDEGKRRRGMIGGDAAFWDDLLSKMDPRQLQQLLAQFGDSKRQGAAVDTLMGRKR